MSSLGIAFLLLWPVVLLGCWLEDRHRAPHPRAAQPVDILDERLC